ncbi:hypothetical protein LJR044_000215 [Microbacterium foliorum]
MAKYSTIEASGDEPGTRERPYRRCDRAEYRLAARPNSQTNHSASARSRASSSGGLNDFVDSYWKTPR